MEFVICDHWTRQASERRTKVVDFDVNNLRLCKNGFAKLIKSEGGTIDSIIGHVRRKQLKLIKDSSKVTERVRKMLVVRKWKQVSR